MRNGHAVHLIVGVLHHVPDDVAAACAAALDAPSQLLPRSGGLKEVEEQEDALEHDMRKGERE